MVFQDIPKLDLYPADETDLLPQLYDRIFSASQGTLTDFSPGSPLAALGEGQVWATLELLWYLNKLPEALALEVMRLAGVARSVGTRATGELVFLLSAPLATPFTLPAGYLVAYTPMAVSQTTGSTGYILQEPLYIPPGSIEGRVKVQAAQPGSVYNRPAFGVAITSLGLAFLQSVYNTEPITGGSDMEPLEDTVRRSQVALRDRKVLVSASDYERVSQELLGNGSRAFCVPLLSSDRETRKPGHVHLFLLTADRQRPGTATCAAIQAALRERAFAGSSTWVSPVALEELRMDITVGVTALSEALAQDIKASIERYLSPFSFTLGASVKHTEVIFAARGTAGVTEVTDLLIQGEPLNCPMPVPYAFPILGVLTVTQIDQNGLSQVFYVGSGMGDPG